MDEVIKLNYVLMCKKDQSKEKLAPICRKGNGSCVFLNSINNEDSELQIIETINLCPLNHQNTVLQNIIKKIFTGIQGEIDKEQLIFYREDVYSAISIAEEEILLSIEKGNFECSDVQGYVESLINLFAEECKEDI